MARVASTSGSFSPREAEAISVREDHGSRIKGTINACIIESDSLHTIEGIRQKRQKSCFHLVIDYCKAMIKLFRHVQFRHVLKFANILYVITSFGWSCLFFIRSGRMARSPFKFLTTCKLPLTAHINANFNFD